MAPPHTPPPRECQARRPPTHTLPPTLPTHARTHACCGASLSGLATSPLPYNTASPGPQLPSLWTHAAALSTRAAGQPPGGTWASPGGAAQAVTSLLPHTLRARFSEPEVCPRKEARRTGLLGNGRGRGCFRERQAGWREAGEPRNVTGKKKRTPGIVVLCWRPGAPRP